MGRFTLSGDHCHHELSEQEGEKGKSFAPLEGKAFGWGTKEEIQREDTEDDGKYRRASSPHTGNQHRREKNGDADKSVVYAHLDEQERKEHGQGDEGHSEEVSHQRLAPPGKVGKIPLSPLRLFSPTQAGRLFLRRFLSHKASVCMR